MANKRRANVTDLELLRGVVHQIWDQGEVMESDLYHLVGNKGRIPPILDAMSEQGFLVTRIRESGQRVPLYSYTDKGRLYCMCWLLVEDLWRIEGEAAIDEGWFTEIYGMLGRRYGSDRSSQQVIYTEMSSSRSRSSEVSSDASAVGGVAPPGRTGAMAGRA